MLDLLLAIQIDFIKIRLVDVIDILLVALLLYQLYKLLKGSIAFNIFIGLSFLFGIWFLVRALEMRMISNILNQFIGLGVIALVIVFQPEIRRFLLLLGKGGRFTKSEIWQKYILREEIDYQAKSKILKETVDTLAKSKTGALIVLTDATELQLVVDNGVQLNAMMSKPLLESIFQKDSALHDGAVIIHENKIIAAGCTLPVSSNVSHSKVGTRHKAAVGITEQSDALAIIVSEENGSISLANNGKLNYNLSKKDFSTALDAFLHSGDGED